MQDSREKKQCLIFVRNNANDTADRIEAYAKKSGMEVVETIFNTDKKAVERLRSVSYTHLIDKLSMYSEYEVI